MIVEGGAEVRIMHVQVAFGSKHGATAEIAEAVARRLGERGVDVAIDEAGEVVGGADAMVVGSSVYLGRWTSSARRLIERLGREEYTGPVWLFHSGPTGENAENPEPFPKKIRTSAELLDVRDWRTFGGKLDPADHRIFGRALADEAGDWRDWDAISDWADSIADAVGADA